MKDVFGIDLGTTNSCIATIGEDGLPYVIKNLDDEYTTPSVVFYDDDDQYYVGKEAKSGMSVEVDRIVAFIKREMSNKNYSRTIDGKKISTKIVRGAQSIALQGMPANGIAIIRVAYPGMSKTFKINLR